MQANVDHASASISGTPVPEAILCADEPQLLKGFVSEWPAVTQAQQSDKAAAEYISSFYQGAPLTVYEGEPEIGGRIFYNKDFSGFNFSRTRQSLTDVIDKVFSAPENSPAPTYYVGSTMVDHWLPGFRAENDIDLGEHDRLVSIWMGNRSRIAPHYDFPNNIACVVAGKRRFTLFPPDQFKNLYVGPLDLTPSGQAISLVDVNNPDFERFPNYKEALKQARVFDLEAGDAIFIPSMWWHNVESLSRFNVLVNYWWRATPAYLGAPGNALLHTLMAMKDLPTTQKKAWKDLFDYYVFDNTDEQYAHIPERVRGVLGELNAERASAIKAQLVKFLK